MSKPITRKHHSHEHPKPSATKGPKASYVLAPGQAYVLCSADTAHYDGSKWPHKVKAVPTEAIRSLEAQHKTQWLSAASRTKYVVPQFNVSGQIDSFFKPLLAQRYKARDSRELYKAVSDISGIPYSDKRSDTVTTIIAAKLAAGLVDINAFMVAVSDYRSTHNKTQLNDAFSSLGIPVAFHNQTFRGACMLINIE